MPHLPNEIWVSIISHCEARDIWLSFRSVNQQLRAVAEQYFAREFLPHIVLSLPIALPTYDIRSPIRGKAIFHPEDALSDGRDSDRIFYVLNKTEPEHYHEHFLGRWRGMCDSDGGALKEKMTWEMSLRQRTDSARLRRPHADGMEHRRMDHAQVSFEWKASVTSFFR